MDTGDVERAAVEMSGADAGRPWMLTGGGRGQSGGQLLGLPSRQGSGAADDNQFPGVGVAAGDHGLGPAGGPDDRPDDHVEVLPGPHFDPVSAAGTVGGAGALGDQPFDPGHSVVDQPFEGGVVVVGVGG